MVLSDMERRVLSELADRLRRELGAKEVWLYGSAARGELEDGSDIDLLVVLGRADWDTEKRVIDCCVAAERQIRRIVSTACFSEEDLTRTPLRASPFLRYARQEAIPL